MLKKTAAATSAVMILALPFTAREEGLRLSAYLDSVGVPTICYGETEGVSIGDKKTKKECDALFYAKLGSYAYAVDSMLQPELNPKTHAALTSWTYNVGLNAARKSTLVKKANNGDLVGACNELPRWKYAGKKPILLKRRLREQKLCLEGIRDDKQQVHNSINISYSVNN